MAITHDTSQAATPPLVLTRTFNAPRELVFRAWSAAEHLKHWFCPLGFTVPHADVEFRPGGKFDLCMRSPQGQEHWIRGHYVEITPSSRLVIDMSVVSESGAALFNTHTTVDLAQVGAGTRLEVTQQFTLLDPSASQFTRGAEEGWRQTLGRLDEQLARMLAPSPGASSGSASASVPAGPVARSVVHGMFSIERTYDATPAQVFRALTDIEAKARWFVGGTDQKILSRKMDVRPGGREFVQGRWKSGLVTTFDALYFDVIPDERLVYTYEMHLDERKISVSLATLELKAAGKGTRLVMTEHGAFLDGYDDAGSREHGTGFLLDALGAWLKTAAQ